MTWSLAQRARIVWALCLLIGTCTHVASLIKYGWSYSDVPIASVFYWNSLTILDPLAAALLFLRPRMGVVATLVIMVSDVVHNIWVVAAFGGIVWMVVAQLAFLVLVLATTPLIWRDAPGLKA